MKKIKGLRGKITKIVSIIQWVMLIAVYTWAITDIIPNNF